MHKTDITPHGQGAIAKAGKLLCVDEGEYSDYFVKGFFVILQDFCPMQLLSEFLETFPEYRVDYRFDSNAFLAFLIKRGLLLEIEYGALFMGTYHQGDISFTPFTENEN